jgi:hypothetical protein
MSESNEGAPVSRLDPELLTKLIELFTLHQEGLLKVKERVGGAPVGVSLDGLNTHVEYLRRDVVVLQQSVKEIVAELNIERRDEQKEMKADDRTSRALRLTIIGMIITGVFALASFIFMLISFYRTAH